MSPPCNKRRDTFAARVNGTSLTATFIPRLKHVILCQSTDADWVLEDYFTGFEGIKSEVSVDAAGDGGVGEL